MLRSWGGKETSYHLPQLAALFLYVLLHELLVLRRAHSRRAQRYFSTLLPRNAAAMRSLLCAILLLCAATQRHGPLSLQQRAVLLSRRAPTDCCGVWHAGSSALSAVLLVAAGAMKKVLQSTFEAATNLSNTVSTAVCRITLAIVVHTSCAALSVTFLFPFLRSSMSTRQRSLALSTSSWFASTMAPCTPHPSTCGLESCSFSSRGRRL